MKDTLTLLKNTSSLWDKLKVEKPRVVLYGMGDGAVKLLNILENLGVKCYGIFASDDFVRYQSFMGFTVKKLTDIEEEIEDFVVLSAFATRLESVIENFYNISKRHPFFVPDINVSGDYLELFDNAFVSRFSDRIEKVYFSLDDVGKEFYKALILYKFTGELTYLEKIEELRCSSPPPFDCEKVTSFADFGAYIGDTILEAKSLYPNLSEAVGYEPDEKNFKKLVLNTENIGIPVTSFNCLVLDRECEIPLLSGGAMNTIILDNVLMVNNLQKKKERKVKAVTGDGTLPFVPNLIKMDVEGCERAALDGCFKTIRDSSPILKVSIYHNHRDVFEIFEKISEINNSYKYTIRQKCRYIPAWDIELIAKP
ncbi:MAG: FkbM family methyltransferase [Ruminococcaceae bacterium]|nr:FkbM family methyltransferase [Oscillospiraceae bacterium]